MRSNYDILNIAPDADKSEIKKAYFRMVKTCSPEKNPEGFKELRKAYEILMNDSSRAQYDKILDAPKEYLHELHEANHLMKQLLYADAREILKALDSKYPGQQDIGTALSECYLETGKTNLGIKTLKSLIDKYPDNQSLSLRLAKAYKLRGFSQKAAAEYKKAIEIDPTNPTAWSSCIEYYYSNQMPEVELLVERALKISEDMFNEYYHIYILALNEAEHKNAEHKILIKYLNKFLDGFIADQNVSDENISSVLRTLKNFTKSTDYSPHVKKVIPKLEEICIRKESYLESVEYIKFNILACDYFNDDKIPSELEGLTRLVLEERDVSEELNDFFGPSDKEIEASRLALEMAVLTNVASIKKAILYTKSEYPDIYDLNKDFYRKALDTKNLDYSLEKYSKKIMKLLKTAPWLMGASDLLGNPGASSNKKDRVDSDGIFDTLSDLSEQSSLFEDVIDDSEFPHGFDFSNSEQPFVREQPKVGRNQPCPCGSGKKYKHCCGK